MITSKEDRKYQQCKLSVMDNIADPNITFDKNGICNYYYEYLEVENKHVKKGIEGKNALNSILEKIKLNGKRKRYDSIIGLSGGIDSTYLALLAKKNKLRPLLVHFDYGWNSEMAIKNIENTTKILGFELYTYVMDWSEFKDLQRSYFYASVLDLDVPADHMIFGALFKTAKKFGIKYILSGNNIQTEYTLPKSWNYNKFDMVNLKNIYKKFGSGKGLKHLPSLGLKEYMFYQLVLNIKLITILDLVDYNKDRIKKEIIEQLNWQDYGGKHHESVFTRFYQGYILPNKFFIDKRKAHLSNLIFSNQITKAEAEAELLKPTYDNRLQELDKEYVSKKLEFTNDQFEKILKQQNVEHSLYGTDQEQRILYFKIMNLIKPITGIIKKIRN
jgi:N-acetyl sugar amidotransferase